MSPNIMNSRETLCFNIGQSKSFELQGMAILTSKKCAKYENQSS